MVYSLHLPLPSDCGSTSKAWWKTKSSKSSVLTSTYFNSRNCTPEQKKWGLCGFTSRHWCQVMHAFMASGKNCGHSHAPGPLSGPLHIFSPCHIPICQGHNPRWQRSPSTLSQWINERKDTFSHTVDRHGPMPTLMLTHDVRMCRPRKHDVVVVLWRGGRGCAARSFSRP